MQREPLSAHPRQVQIWAIRTLPPWACRIGRWVGFAIGLGIRLFTLGKGGRYSHLLLRCGNVIWEAAASGVRRGSVEEYDARHYVVDAYAAPLTPMQQGAVLNFAVGHADEHTGYDFRQIARLALRQMGLRSLAERMPDGGEDQVICSEFVALAHLAGNVKISETAELWEFCPDDIRQSSRDGLVSLVGRVDFGKVCQ